MKKLSRIMMIMSESKSVTDSPISKDSIQQGALKLNSTFDATDNDKIDDGLLLLQLLINQKLNDFKVDKLILDYANKVRRGKIIKSVLMALVGQATLIVVIVLQYLSR